MKRGISILAGCLIALLFAAGCATQKPATFLPIQIQPATAPRVKALVGPRISAQVVTNPITLLVSRSITPPPGVALAWNASADPAVTGYNVYQGFASRSYTNVFATTNLSLSVSNLAFSSTYYFTATATAPGLESDYCNEVVYTTPSQLLPPGNLRIQASWASNIGGPWLQDTNWQAVVIANPMGNLLWRLDATRSGF